MKVKVLDLKPTQFAVGMLEIDAKIKIAEEFSDRELLKYVRDNIVPVVRGPDNHLYVVDKHHYLSVCYHVGIDRVRVNIIEDFKNEKKNVLSSILEMDAENQKQLSLLPVWRGSARSHLSSSGHSWSGG